MSRVIALRHSPRTSSNSARRRECKTTRDGPDLLNMAKKKWKAAIKAIHPGFGQEVIHDPTYEPGTYQRWCIAWKRKANPFRAHVLKAIQYLESWFIANGTLGSDIAGLETTEEILCFCGRLHEEIGQLHYAYVKYAAARLFGSDEAAEWMARHGYC